MEEIIGEAFDLWNQRKDSTSGLTVAEKSSETLYTELTIVQTRLTEVLRVLTDLFGAVSRIDSRITDITVENRGIEPRHARIATSAPEIRAIDQGATTDELIEEISRHLKQAQELHERVSESTRVAREGHREAIEPDCIGEKQSTTDRGS